MFVIKLCLQYVLPLRLVLTAPRHVTVQLIPFHVTKYPEAVTVDQVTKGHAVKTVRNDLLCYA